MSSNYKQTKIFPIKTATACQLKWSWSTIFLTTGTTASCHRVQHYPITEDFNFHNTPEKIKARELMLEGKWPGKGCEYCRDIESAGGQSDRITNLDMWEFAGPAELEADPTATYVTPRILEIYFSNTCNLKCTYCSPYFSSLWDDENKKFGGTRFSGSQEFVNLGTRFSGSSRLEINKQKCFNWLKDNIEKLYQLNILGGEPLYQEEFDQLLDVLEDTPAPNLKLTFFSNLAVAENKLVSKIDRIEQLINKKHVKKLEITASLDCWGPEQEFARFPLNLKRWEKNFEYLLDKEWITLIIGSTITPVTIWTLDQLLEKINNWNKIRDVWWYGNSVNGFPQYMYIDIFGDAFTEEFDRALALFPEQKPEHRSAKIYLTGIRDQAKSKEPNLTEIKNLYIFLDEMDKRRNTDWRSVYPKLVELFQQHLGDEYDHR